MQWADKVIFSFLEIMLLLEDIFLLWDYFLNLFRYVVIFFPIQVKYFVLIISEPKWVYCSEITYNLINPTYHSIPQRVEVSFDAKYFGKKSIKSIE